MRRAIPEHVSASIEQPVPPAHPLAIGETRVASAPEMLSALGSRSCFVLVLYDEYARVGGITRLQVPGSDVLGSYIRVATQNLVAQMRGSGAVREHPVGHIIAGQSVPMSALRTAVGAIHAQGLRGVKRHSLSATDDEIRFSLEDGRLEITSVARTRRPADNKQLAVEVGTQILDLYLLRQDVSADKPDPPLAPLLQQIAQAAARVLGDAQCFLALQDKDGLVLKAASHLASGATPADPLALALFARGAPALINNVRQELGIQFPARSPVLSAISAPLSEPAIQGLLYAVHPTSNAFSGDDLSSLQLFANQATVAIKNAHLYQKLTAKIADLEAILQGIGDGLLVVNPEFKLVMANPVARELLNLGDGPSTGDPFPTTSPLAPLLLRARGEGCTIEEISLRGGLAGQPPLTCQATISEIEGPDNQSRGIVAVLRDITEQRETERLRNELMSAVSHELRTPLHSISGFVDLILMGKTGNLNELQRDFLTTVKQQSSHLQHIINDVLEFSRLEYGQARLTLERVDVNELVSSILHKLALMASDNRIHLMKAVPDSLPTIQGDSMRLEQVLSNLVDNALKFTPKGGMVTIGAEDLGETLRLWVADTGIGIPPEEREKIFHKYYQVSGGANTPGPRRGAGLGLTICKHIVEQHGGTIWVESELGRGSTFYIELPKQESGEEGTSPASPSEQPEPEQAAFSMPALEVQPLP